MSSSKMTLRETLRLHMRAFRTIRRIRPWLFASITAASAASAVTPYIAVYFSARIIDELAAQRRVEVLKNLVLAALIAVGAITLVSGVLGAIKNVMMESCRIRKDMIYPEKMFSMDFADLDDARTRDLRAQIQQTEWWAGWGFDVFIDTWKALAKSIAGIVGAAALTVSLFVSRVPEGSPLALLNHPAAGVALAILFGVCTAIGPACRNKINRDYANISEKARFVNRLYGAFGFICHETHRAADFRIYNQGPIALGYLKTDIGVFGTKGELAGKARAGIAAVCAMGEMAAGALMTGIVYAFVCLKAWAGAFGVGSVTQYVGAATALSANLAKLFSGVGVLRTNAVFLKNIYEFLDIPNAMYQGSLTTEKRADRRYEVEFCDVSFKYPGTDVWALRHVNMKFEIGKRLAIVGENGSGKTTFIKLLCRLYDPQEGQILLNGIDIRKYRYDDYMRIFSIVFQDFQLISQPLGANVAGAAQYDRERVERALGEAGFDERLPTMPKGLETMLYKDIDKDGVDVSCGEAQKIAIARALYKDAPFIVLDEPTAALDPIAEAEIYAKFDEIAGDRTAIYISHRLSSCKFCDEIAVFSGGSVIQKGTHEELLADGEGQYKRLWDAQAQYYNK